MILNNYLLMTASINLKKAIAGLLSAVLFSVILSYPLTYAGAQERENSIKIGVLAYRGAGHALSMWQPTAKHLSAQLPSNSFIIVPLKFEEIRAGLEKLDRDISDKAALN